MKKESDVVIKTDIPNLKLFKRGKVRDVYDLGDTLLIVATDRISAFDVILPTGIPNKGKVLTALSIFWFNWTRSIVENHFLDENLSRVAEDMSFTEYIPILEKRSMIVKKTSPLPVECVVRGYLAGSGWKEYKEKSSVCEVKLASGLVESGKLPTPLFTPATKADTGHDINISEKEVENIVGVQLARELKEKSLSIYREAEAFARSKGIIIADTKMEFGIFQGKLILIDELLTPDSSRFWPEEDYRQGCPQSSFDKQFVRDYLETLDWEKKYPGPPLPRKIVEKTSEKYLDALKRITGVNEFELISQADLGSAK